MEKADQELLLHVLPSNPNLRRLYDRHRKLEKEVESMGRYARYSSAASLRQRELKKLKLQGMEQIMSILRSYKDRPLTT